MLAPWKKNYDQPRQHITKQRHYFANKGPSRQSYTFSNSHIWVWELDCKESWVLKNWCFWTVVLEKTLESPLDCKEIHQSILKEISPEYLLEGLMLKLKLQYFGHLMRRADSFEKTLILGKILGFKITADSDCSHEIKRCLLLRIKAMTKLDSILKKQTLCQQRSI